MNTCLVKLVPKGDFAEVSALTHGWQTKLQLLLQQKQPIRYDFYPLSSFPQEVKDDLELLGYHDLVLEQDQWKHFLVPHSNSIAARTN